MFFKKKLLTFAIGSVFSLCISPFALAVTEIKIAFNQPVDHPQYLALQNFGKEIEAQTEGRYHVEIFQDELLGDQSTALDLVRNNAIQMATIAAPLLENYERTFRILAMPFIYTGPEHQEKVFTSGVVDNLFSSTRKYGFEVLAAYTAGARSIYNNIAPIKRPADVGGQKIRVINSDTMIKMMDCLGGIGIPMPQGEVYAAIQQGIINGAENNEITYAGLKHYEVAPYFSTTHHLMVPDLLVVSESFLADMTPEDQETIRKLARESTVEEFGIWASHLADAKKLSEDNGAHFTEIDNAVFQENCKPLQESMLETVKEKSLFENIQSLR